MPRRWRFLASALALLAGVYILAGPLRDERSDPMRLLAVWPILLAYEFLLIGSVYLLRRRGEDVSWLSAIGVLFLADPVFLGDAFASTDLDFGLRFNAGAWILSLCKAYLLARATRFEIRLRPAGWIAAALLFVHFFPSFLGAYAARPPDFEEQTWGGVMLASALLVPMPGLLRRLGWAAAGAVFAHFAATALVANIRFHVEYLTPPLVALAVILPRDRWKCMSLLAAAGTSPLRNVLTSLGAVDQIGVFFVVGAFALLAWGLIGEERKTILPGRNVLRGRDGADPLPGGGEEAGGLREVDHPAE